MIHTVMSSTITQIVGGRIKIKDHSIVHTPLIKSHHHFRKPLIHSYKIVHLHLPIHTTHFTNHKMYSTIQKIHSIHIHIHKISLNLHLLS
ncbi:hypothetical protein AHAS_Ahas13G0288800 [Arachis hypogaea]